MKSIKLDHDLANKVRAKKVSSTWRLFDDKDLSVDDRVTLIDKVNPKDHDTWKVFGEALINRVTEKRIGEIGNDDFTSKEEHRTPEQLLEQFQRFHGESISMKTPVKIVYFDFFPYDEDQQLDIPNVPVETAATSVDKVKLYADGGSRGNPGPSASGFVIFDEQDAILVDKGVYLGITTNNQAEYTALKLGLEEAHKLQIKEVDVYMDSLLVVNQMKGIFKVKNRDLWPIHEAIKELATKFQQIKYTHVPRELNKAADAAVNRALDAHISDGEERSVV